MRLWLCGAPNLNLSHAQVRLLRPGAWDTVWRHSLDPGEEACSVSTQRLRNSVTGALESFVTVGTALNLGEDYPCTGRVLLFRVARSEEGGAAPGHNGPAAADGQDGATWQGELVASRLYPVVRCCSSGVCAPWPSAMQMVIAEGLKRGVPRMTSVAGIHCSEECEQSVCWGIGEDCLSQH